MSEVKFVLKSFALAIALTMAMQIHVGQDSIEARAELWIHTSPIAKYLQGVADGAVKAMKTASKTASDLINNRNNRAQVEETQNASRWKMNSTHPRGTSNKSESED